MAGHKLTTRDVKRYVDMLVVKQKGTCILCLCRLDDWTVVDGKRKLAYEPVLDHCHDHGHIRAALCRNCNGFEGRIKAFAEKQGDGPYQDWIALYAAGGVPKVRYLEGLIAKTRKDNTSQEWLDRLVVYLQEHLQPQFPFIHPEHQTAYELAMAKAKPPKRTNPALAKLKRAIAHKKRQGRSQ